MQVDLASTAGQPDHPNEDCAFAIGNLVGVLDGVTEPAGAEEGCHHGPAWYVRHLAARIVEAYTDDEATPLTRLLAAAIAAVRDDHGPTCDLDRPDTPAATVSLLKASGPQVEYLVLCDAFLVLDLGDRADLIADDRFDRLMTEIRTTVLAPGAVGTVEQATRARRVTRAKYQYTNQPGGYWIAAADPHAAIEAVTGAVPTRGVRRAALLTDGASAAVDQFALFDWPGMLDVLTEEGSASLIRRVRMAERADPNGEMSPRYKRHDDASVVFCRFD
jgi:hypothetical protein